jgi:DNA-binding NtrC family response regulator
MSKPHILVVDDEPSVLLTYKMILEQEGYEVTAAATSREACKAVLTGGFHLLLCDFSLEQQHTGFEVIAAARKLDPETPCVLLTGYANMETAQQAKQQGIHVLFKPIEIEEFISTTSSLVKNPKLSPGDGAGQR